ncbi:hypothetical protein Hamer_G028795, partial [Homarus americanus]
FSSFPWLVSQESNIDYYSFNDSWTRFNDRVRDKFPHNSDICFLTYLLFSRKEGWGKEGVGEGERWGKGREVGKEGQEKEGREKGGGGGRREWGEGGWGRRGGKERWGEWEGREKEGREKEGGGRRGWGRRGGGRRWGNRRGGEWEGRERRGGPGEKEGGEGQWKERWGKERWGKEEIGGTGEVGEWEGREKEGQEKGGGGEKEEIGEKEGREEGRRRREWGEGGGGRRVMVRCSLRYTAAKRNDYVTYSSDQKFPMTIKLHWRDRPTYYRDQCLKILTENKELINDMIVPLLHQWTKANALFKPPVINQCRTIELKLTKLWHKAVETSLGKGNLARKNEFLHTLDTLFDILTCKCSIQLCSESNCSHSGKRENNSHIDCGCPREKKIPVLELEFIKAQRTKAEGQGSMQMGSIDYSETKKQIANAKKREQIREREQKKKMKSEEAIQREEELCQDVYHFFDIPPINVNATKLSELVDLSLEVLEPPLTTSLTSQELRNLKETPMQVPKWPSHTQSVERCVKMVTEAAGHVYSHERR